jgi:XRE family aerobic/anaerobic benzoate catabolism transcriptional regulator
MESARTRRKASRSEVVSLIGARCSGKTSAGRELARRLGWTFVDLDEEIARADAAARESTETGPAGDVLGRVGEPAFRDLESRALAEVLDRRGPFVLATGGGVVEREANRTLLARRTTCVWLRVAATEMQRRLRSDPTPRPALEGRDAVEELPRVAERREPAYAETCEIELDCRGLRVAEVARRIAERIGRGRPGTCG